MSTWPATKKCSHCRETGRPPHCAMCVARDIIDDLERQLAEAQGKLDAVVHECEDVGEPIAWDAKYEFAQRLLAILSKEGNDG